MVLVCAFFVAGFGGATTMHTIYGANACGCYGGSGCRRRRVPGWKELSRVNGEKMCAVICEVEGFCSTYGRPALQFIMLYNCGSHASATSIMVR